MVRSRSHFFFLVLRQNFVYLFINHPVEQWQVLFRRSHGTLRVSDACGVIVHGASATACQQHGERRLVGEYVNALFNITATAALNCTRSQNVDSVAVVIFR